MVVGGRRVRGLSLRLRVRGRHSPFGFYGTIGFFSFSGDEVVVFLRAPAPLLLASSPRFLLRCVSKSSTRDVPFSCSRPRFCSHRPHNSASPASKNAPLLSRQHCNLNSHQVLFALWGGRITPPHRALDRAREEVGDRQHFLGKLWKRKSPPRHRLVRRRGTRSRERGDGTRRLALRRASRERATPWLPGTRRRGSRKTRG